MHIHTLTIHSAQATTPDTRQRALLLLLLWQCRPGVTRAHNGGMQPVPQGDGESTCVRLNMQILCVFEIHIYTHVHNQIDKEILSV
jgi:hypothetical protein